MRETALVDTDVVTDRPAADAPPRSGDLVARSLRLLPAVLFGSVLFFIVYTGAVPLTNDDTYFHLRFGSEFLHGHWSLWHPGSVSTFATSPWVPTQWLPEVIMAKFEAWFGLAGVAWLSGLQQLGLVVALYLTCRRWAEPLLVVLLLIPTLISASIGLSMRPQVISYILVVVTLWAWLKTLEDGVPRWWLVPVTWLWGMSHGMWPIGIGLGVVGVVGLALDRRTDARGVARAALVPLASAVVAAVTPVGPALYGAVLGVGSRSKFFSEWGAPDYTAVPACLVLAGMFAIGIVLFARAPRRRWSHLLYFLVAGACALWSYRTVPVAAFILMPLLAAAAQSLMPTRAHVVRRPEAVKVVGATVASLALLAVLVPHTSNRPPAQPSWVEPALSALPAGTAVASDWGYGGYLMWRFPRLDPMMHGYGDTYTVPELQRNLDVLTLAPGWDREFRATGCRIALLPPSYRLAYALLHQEGWRVLHRSPSLEMLVAPPSWPAAG